MHSSFIEFTTSDSSEQMDLTSNAEPVSSDDPIIMRSVPGTPNESYTAAPISSRSRRTSFEEQLMHNISDIPSPTYKKDPWTLIMASGFWQPKRSEKWFKRRKKQEEVIKCSRRHPPIANSDVRHEVTEENTAGTDPAEIQDRVNPLRHQFTVVETCPCQIC